MGVTCLFLVNIKRYLPDNTQSFCLNPDGSVLPDLHIEDNEEETNKTQEEMKDVKRWVTEEGDAVRAMQKNKMRR